MSRFQYRNKKQNFVSNFVFQIIKKKKWYTDYGDPISAYLFIIALDIIFAMIKSNPSIKGLNIFNHNY